MVEIWHRLDGATISKGRPKPRLPVRRNTIGRNAYDIELKPMLACRTIVSEWRDLAARTIEPNIFSGPEMMLSAALHLPAMHPPAVLMVRERTHPQHRLVGLFPLEKGWFPVLPGAVRAHTTPYHPVGIPLVDAHQAIDVLATVLDWLADHAHAIPGFGPGSAGVAGMLWPDVPLEGNFTEALREVASRTGRNIALFDPTERRILRASSSGNENFLQTLPSKQRKEIERCHRRMSEYGRVRFEEAVGGRPLRDAIEIFMVLEALSWKGSQGSALIQSARTSGFIRSATRMLAHSGQISVLTLYCGETPAAAAILLDAGERSWYYKIAYDPAFARMSPGVVLSAELSRRQEERATVEETDSCADGPNPLVDALWSEQTSYADMLVSVVPGETHGAAFMLWREQVRRDLRKKAKSIYRRLKGARK